MKIGFIGLGVMGGPMAAHLSKAGFDLSVYNRTSAKTQAWLAQHKGVFAHSPAQAAQDADLVVLCVGRDEDVWSVLADGEGVLSNIRPGAVVLDHTTTSANLARRAWALCNEQSVCFMDAPVSGGQAGAQKGELTIMCGGNPDTFAQAEPVMRHYAKAVRLMGASGHGQLTKMVNQICVAGLLQGLAEGIQFGIKAGLDVESVIQVISKGAAQSWQMENRYQTMLAGAYDHGFAVDWMRKDLNICLEEARSNGALLPVTALIDQFYAEIQHMGGGRWDTSSLLSRLLQVFANPPQTDI